MKKELQEAKEVLDLYFGPGVRTKEEAKEAWEVIYGWMVEAVECIEALGYATLPIKIPVIEMEDRED